MQDGDFFDPRDRVNHEGSFRWGHVALFVNVPDIKDTEFLTHDLLWVPLNALANEFTLDS